MKKLFFFAAAAAMFAACSSDDGLTSQPQTAQQPAAQQAVGFDAYTQRALTRAGLAGEDMDIDNLKKAVGEKGGFGVFAYYTNNNTYDGLTTPNFMYNQGVFWNTDKWEYSPEKYWPNEYGENATSDDTDKVTFFAYAPYVALESASTGKVAAAEATSGIVGMSRNSAIGDPFVKYIADLDPSKAVDLLWGVADGDDAYGTSTDVTWNPIDGTTDQTMTAGLPWKDVKRPSETDQKLKFTFKHSLSKLNVQVDAYVDGTDATNAVADNTKIYIRSITFNGFALKGALNLNNTTANKPLWMDFNGANDLEVGEEITIYDGRKDGKEGAAAATNEKLTGLNDVLIQSDKYTLTPSFSATTDGVTKTAVNLFNSTTATDAIYVIPTGETPKVTIVYDVETYDPNLSTLLSDDKAPGSSIENRISQTISFGTDAVFEAGKFYTLKLHLGMNSVKYDAAVEAWVDGGEHSYTYPEATTGTTSGN